MNILFLNSGADQYVSKSAQVSPPHQSAHQSAAMSNVLSSPASVDQSECAAAETLSTLGKQVVNKKKSSGKKPTKKRPSSKTKITNTPTKNKVPPRTFYPRHSKQPQFKKGMHVVSKNSEGEDSHCVIITPAAGNRLPEVMWMKTQQKTNLDPATLHHCAFKVGELVQCQRKDGKWYKGQVTAKFEQGRPDVLPSYDIVPVTETLPESETTEIRFSATSVRKHVWEDNDLDNTVDGPHGLTFEQEKILKEKEDKEKKKRAQKEAERQAILNKGNGIDDLMCTPKVLAVGTPQVATPQVATPRELPEASVLMTPPGNKKAGPPTGPPGPPTGPPGTPSPPGTPGAPSTSKRPRDEDDTETEEEVVETGYYTAQVSDYIIQQTRLGLARTRERQLGHMRLVEQVIQNLYPHNENVDAFAEALRKAIKEIPFKATKKLSKKPHVLRLVKKHKPTKRGPPQLKGPPRPPGPPGTPRGPPGTFPPGTHEAKMKVRLHKTVGRRLDRVELYIPKLLSTAPNGTTRRYLYFKKPEMGLLNNEFTAFATKTIREITKGFTWEQLYNWLHETSEDDGDNPNLQRIAQDYLFPDDQVAST